MQWKKHLSKISLILNMCQQLLDNHYHVRYQQIKIDTYYIRYGDLVEEETVCITLQFMDNNCAIVLDFAKDIYINQ